MQYLLIYVVYFIFQEVAFSQLNVCFLVEVTVGRFVQTYEGLSVISCNSCCCGLWPLDIYGMTVWSTF